MCLNSLGFNRFIALGMVLICTWMIHETVEAESTVSVSMGYALPVSPIGKNSFSEKYQCVLFPQADVDGLELLAMNWGGRLLYLESAHKDFPSVKIGFLPVLVTGSYALMHDKTQALKLSAGVGPSWNFFSLGPTSRTDWVGAALDLGTSMEWFMGDTFSAGMGISDMVLSPAKSDQDWLGLLLFRAGVWYYF